MSIYHNDVAIGPAFGPVRTVLLLSGFDRWCWSRPEGCHKYRKTAL